MLNFKTRKKNRKVSPNSPKSYHTATSSSRARSSPKSASTPLPSSTATRAAAWPSSASPPATSASTSPAPRACSSPRCPPRRPTCVRLSRGCTAATRRAASTRITPSRPTPATRAAGGSFQGSCPRPRTCWTRARRFWGRRGSFFLLGEKKMKTWRLEKKFWRSQEKLSTILGIALKPKFLFKIIKTKKLKI